jgi:hypothetical protein
VLARRSLLMVAASVAVSTARAQSRLAEDWLGLYVGTIRFYGSIPLEDIYPPPAHPHVDFDEPSPLATQFSIHLQEDGTASVWLRIDGGPMQTAERGEKLYFGPLAGGVADLARADAKPAPRSATLIVRPDSLGIEALFSYADGSFWRRHFYVRFTPAGADLIVWVFDAAGTRARTWRGIATRQALSQSGRGPT